MMSKRNTECANITQSIQNMDTKNAKIKVKLDIWGQGLPGGETALAGEGEGVRFTFDQIIIEQVKTK